MNYIELYRLVSKNKNLAAKRHPLFERNRFMKIFIYLTLAFWGVYLFALGVMAAITMKNDPIEPYDTIDKCMIFFLIIDFYLRFMIQETPSQEIKPYKLLPVSEKGIINVFLVRIGLQPLNLIWFFFLVPFGVLCIPRIWGITGLIGWLLGWLLVFVLNSYWYLLWRTLVNRKMIYVLIPTAIFAALIYFGLVRDEDNQWLFYSTLCLGQGFILWKWWAFAIMLGAIAIFYFINYPIQMSSIYREISREGDVTKVKSSNMTFLDRYGVIGEYLKLEIKSIRRNKTVRHQFLVGIIYTIALCLLLAFTDVYDNTFMKVFICVYCFACLGCFTLTNVMCHEGNYMDLLMSRKESVLSLLKAKYYFNCIVLLLPLLIILVPVVQGKLTFPGVLGCMLFTSGVVFPFLFQLAVYNKSTLSLNNKLTGKNNMQTSKMQMIMSMVALFTPMIFMNLLIVVFGDNKYGAPLVMTILGIVGTLLHPLWLRDIYNRFLKRRYTNLQGFRDSKR